MAEEAVSALGRPGSLANAGTGRACLSLVVDDAQCAGGRRTGGEGDGTREPPEQGCPLHPG